MSRIKIRMGTAAAAAAAVALVTMGATECQTAGQTAPEPSTPAECKKEGGYWHARDCWWGEDARRYRCEKRDDNPEGMMWSWDFGRHRCQLVPQD